MKHYHYFLAILSGLFILTACGQTSATKAYDVAIFDQKTTQTFHLTDDGRLEPLEHIKRKSHKSFWKESFTEANDVYYAKTTEGNDLTTLIESIDKTTLTETAVKAGGNDAYTSVTDGEYFYATAVFTDRIDFYKYDKALAVVHKASIPNQETINASQQFILYEDSLYLLVSTVDKATSIPNTEIWQMDKSFQVLEKINLATTSAYLRMALIGRKVYLAETFAEGRSENGGYLGGTNLLVFDFETRQASFIPLATPYPRQLLVDEMAQHLLIEHASDHLHELIWTVLDLNTGQAVTINLSDQTSESYLTPHVSAKHGNYYFLFPDRLLIYQAEGTRITDIDLTPYGITNAHALIIN